jgi:hypothetical protein
MQAMKSLATYLIATGLAVFLTPAQHAPARTAVGEILPLGDSITDGEAGTGGGYRARLHLLLNNSGDAFNLVGSATNNSTAALTASGQHHHEGHSGYRIDQIQGNLTGYVSSAPVSDSSDGGHWLDGGSGTDRAAIFPDLILLHIGTNDASQGRTAAQMQSLLQSLLTTIRTNRPNAQVIVTSLILRTDDPDLEATQRTYNSGIPAIVGAQGGNFHFLDMHAVLNAGDLIDGVHPNQGGYDKMANAWVGALHTVAGIEPLSVASAVSRKTHGPGGNFDLDLPLTGDMGVECRSAGDTGAHTLLFTFTNNVSSGTATVTGGTGAVSGSPTLTANTMSVNLTGVTDAQELTVTLSGVTDAYAQGIPATPVKMNVLLGDTTGDGSVNSTDIAHTRSQVGSAVTDTNFRHDVTTDNTINSSDIATIKAQSGGGLP